MSSATIKKIIPCKKEQLIEMVLDIEKYPEFVPWCIEGKLYDKIDNNDVLTFKGDLYNLTLLNVVTLFRYSNCIIKPGKPEKPLGPALIFNSGEYHATTGLLIILDLF